METDQKIVDSIGELLVDRSYSEVSSVFVIRL